MLATNTALASHVAHNLFCFDMVYREFQYQRDPEFQVWKTLRKEPISKTEQRVVKLGQNIDKRLADLESELGALKAAPELNLKRAEYLKKKILERRVASLAVAKHLTEMKIQRLDP